MKIDNFTLLIPVRGRQYNLPKVIEFYAELECKKIIIDSSETKYSDIQSLTNAGFEYRHFPKMNFYDKMQLNVALIDTKYMLDAPDDDYYRPEAIKECVAFLESDERYVVCDGVYLNLEIDHILPKYAGSFFELPHKKDYRKRLTGIFSRLYYARNHSVVRTEVTKAVFNFIGDENPALRSVDFLDRYFTFIAALYGNFKVLPILYSLKKGGNDRIINQVNPKELNRAPWKDNLNRKYLGPLSKLVSEIKSNEEDYSFVLKIFKDNAVGRGVARDGDPRGIISKHLPEINKIKRIMWS